MAIKVMIKRHVKARKTQEAFALLNDFRIGALNQPGYISGETLVNRYEPGSILVVSTWQTLEDWIRWQESDERAANEAQLESLLEEPARYEIYDLGVLPQNK
ncbi:MAG: antibiotic biosynthesis monooxygenase [Desulfobacterales bacterium]|nr:MAG: antibiotic biosynthesis monooxygenase [Desulfobacterales bacterium]